MKLSVDLQRKRNAIIDNLNLLEIRINELRTALKMFDEINFEDEVLRFIFYVNYEKQYKFTTKDVLSVGTRQNSSYVVTENEFDKCNHLNIGERKCDIFSDSHLAGLIKCHEESQKVHDTIKKIKKGEY